MLGLEDELIEAEIPDTYIIRFGPNDDNNSNGKTEKARNISNTNYMTTYDVFSKLFDTSKVILFMMCVMVTIQISFGLSVRFLF